MAITLAVGRDPTDMIKLKTIQVTKINVDSSGVETKSPCYDLQLKIFNTIHGRQVCANMLFKHLKNHS